MSLEVPHSSSTGGHGQELLEGWEQMLLPAGLCDTPEPKGKQEWGFGLGISLELITTFMKEIGVRYSLLKMIHGPD